MGAKRITSKKTGRTGWLFRVISPLTGTRIRKRFWFAEKREAEQALKKWLEKLEARVLGLPDSSGWQMRYETMVGRFLAEAPLSTERRKKYLKQVLEKNFLGLRVGADLAHLGKLTARCQKLVAEKQTTDHFAVFSVQAPVKQLSRWAASVGLLPYDPLNAWKRLPWGGQKRIRRAFTPEEMRAILEACEEHDEFFCRKLPSTIIFKALLLSGNRPGAVLAGKVGDLYQGRIVLPPGSGKKRNGMATLPPEFIEEVAPYLVMRGNPKTEEPLFASYRGKSTNRLNLGPDFKRSMVLAFTRMNWPSSIPMAAHADPIEVAHLLYTGKCRGFDGAPPTDAKKIAERAIRKKAALEIAERLRPIVSRLMIGRDMYCLRKTHISWARRLVSPDSVRVQVGHAGRDVEERHYLDLVDPRTSSQAVWDVLVGRRTLDGKSVATVQKDEPKGEVPQDVGPNVATFPKNDERTA